MHLPWTATPVTDSLTVSTSITPAEANELRDLAGGADVLEIGAAFGFSAITMALAGARSVTSVDPHQQIRDSLTEMSNNIGLAGAPNITIIRGASPGALADLAEAGRRFDFVFIDGDHTERAVRDDVLAVVLPPLLRSGGTLACHDYGEDCCCPGVRVALDALFPHGPDRLTGSLFIIETQPGQRIATAAAEQQLVMA
jgi:hypothetical protein